MYYACPYVAIFNTLHFIEVDHDPTNRHIVIVNNFVEKWKHELTKQWIDFISCNEARPGKNSTFYKTHKSNISVRLLTTGCGTAIQNLAIFVEKHCAHLADQIPTRIKDTQHFLRIVTKPVKLFSPLNSTHAVLT